VVTEVGSGEVALASGKAVSKKVPHNNKLRYFFILTGSYFLEIMSLQRSKTRFYSRLTHKIKL
jgi:hypothetical protein